MTDWTLADEREVEKRCARFRRAKLALDRGVPEEPEDSPEDVLGQER
ncbi:MAG: hypothetical protein HOY71_28030 [Nonomuraea sp.]|nr:hypothetical protein [Nonomuraea sp.]